MHVPRFRDGTFSTRLFSSYARSEQALLLEMMEMVIQAVSTRRVSEMTETLCGKSFSKRTVSLLCKQLNPLVEAFQHRPLSRHDPFLIVDAIYMKSRDHGAVRSKGMLLALGVSEDGHREVLGFMVSDGESYASWSRFFASLKARGLHAVDHVTSDQHGGLVKAVREQFCGATWQRCQTHFSRNLLDLVHKKERAEVHHTLLDMYNSPKLEEAYRRKENLLATLSKMAPKAAALLDDGFDDITAVYALPEPYRKRLRTSNNIERLNEEIRRRERVIRIFPNEKSMERIIGSLLLEQHEKWISGKVYFSMQTYWDEKQSAKDLAENVRRTFLLGT